MRLHVSILMVVALTSSSCGDDDNDGSTAPTYGTCDLRDIQSTCIESTGTALSIENQKQGCEDEGASWSEDPCPDTADRIGCCEYEYGMDFRECWYTGTATADPEAKCGTFDGTWTAD